MGQSHAYISHKPKTDDWEKIPRTISAEDLEMKSNRLAQKNCDSIQKLGLPTTFASSKGRKHVDASAMRIKSSRHGRQYMNRRGGFNRPLPAEKTGVRLNDF